MAKYDPLTGIVGVVGKDPVIKNTSAGDVTEFSVAVSDGFGEEANTTWYRVSVWDEATQAALQQPVSQGGIGRGSHVAIQGVVKPGNEGYGPDIKAFRVSPLNWYPRGKREAAPASQDDGDF